VSAASRRITTTLVVAALLAVLLVSKYLTFTLASLAGLTGGAFALPGFLARLEWLGAVGLSFYTFSAISYVVDVSRRVIPAERQPARVALYLAYFPKLLAGPIERAPALLPRFDSPVFNEAMVVSGLQQMLWGLFKKVVIADRLAVFVDRVYAQPSFAAPADLVLATYAFAFQLYCDFSGYSDIAIGASRVLGVDLAENFRRPYLATSVSEFWAGRWHLSLSTWFRDYLYIPLGGSRVPLARRMLNVLVVFLLSGLWHGANWTFAAWGGLNGLYVASGTAWRYWRRPGETEGASVVMTAFRCLATFHLVLITWVFFRAATIADALTVLSRVVSSAAALPLQVWARVQVGDLWLSFALVGLLMLAEWLDERRPLWKRLHDRPRPVRWAAYYAVGAALLVLGVWSRQQFVYMQF
jgi:D-alanyl-lipoteichoic acid acyltransferase DltB (MBOAT superfamily)